MGENADADKPVTLDMFMKDYVKTAKKKVEEAQHDHEEEGQLRAEGTSMKAAMMPRKKKPSTLSVLVQETTVDADDHLIESGFS